MRSWPGAPVPQIADVRLPLRLFDGSTDQVRPTAPGEKAGMYVCGITPYDATHMGHAATYVAFDLVHRYWRAAGHRVCYVQNVTDVDDPLLQRAVATGQDWKALADAETQGFREDMAALRVLPPTKLIGAVESIPAIVVTIETLAAQGLTYHVGQDLYLEITRDEHFGSVAHLNREQMLTEFAAMGGDPDRPGKRDPLDPLLWRAERAGEPCWQTEIGPGRPGWHVECTSIATEFLGMGFDIQGGGRDLAFPHHEMCASTGQLAEKVWPFARHYVHTGMVGLDNKKMSKSLGNLVFVRELRQQGIDPNAIRLALLAKPYADDWSWTDELLQRAQQRLATWRQAFRAESAPGADYVTEQVVAGLADNLAAPAALLVIDEWADRTCRNQGADGAAPRQVRDLVDALLGVV